MYVCVCTKIIKVKAVDCLKITEHRSLNAEPTLQTQRLIKIINAVSRRKARKHHCKAQSEARISAELDARISIPQQYQNTGLEARVQHNLNG